MSYPSVAKIVKDRGLDLSTASDTELREAIWQALNTDLKDGIDYLAGLSDEVKRTGKKVVRPENPESPLGKKIIRLLGTDIARQILSQKLGIQFAFYNCCCAVGAPTAEELKLSAREQIELQDETVATMHC